MEKIKNYIILLFFGCIFVLIFKYSEEVKISVLDSVALWLNNLVPSMLPMYLIVDLLINYGIYNLFYNLTKNNTFLLIFISLLTGSPSNAKYIKEFYENGYISLDKANLLLTFSFSPNPLFILAISPTLKSAMLILGYIYIMNIINYLIFKNKFFNKCDELKSVKKLSFTECLENSIYKSFNVLFLILGIIVVYGIVNVFLNILNINSLFLSSILEMTNALSVIKNNNFPILWALFAVSFAGLSIHTQIKSILENTKISYKYFLYGRLIAALPILIIIIFNYIFIFNIDITDTLKSFGYFISRCMNR